MYETDLEMHNLTEKAFSADESLNIFIKFCSKPDVTKICREHQTQCSPETKLHYWNAEGNIARTLCQVLLKLVVNSRFYMVYFYIENLLHNSGIMQKVIFKSVQNPISLPGIKFSS